MSCENCDCVFTENSVKFSVMCNSCYDRLKQMLLQIYPNIYLDMAKIREKMDADRKGKK